MFSATLQIVKLLARSNFGYRNLGTSKQTNSPGLGAVYPVSGIGMLLAVPIPDTEDQSFHDATPDAPRLLSLHVNSATSTSYLDLIHCHPKISCP